MSASKRARKGGLSVSLVIAVLLAASGVVRLFGGTGAAIAREVAALAPDKAPVESVQAVCPAAPEIDRLLVAIREREDAADARDAANAARAEQLDEASALIAEQMTALAEAEAALADTIASAEAAAENDLSQLTTVYENMKPKQAAAVFEEMDPEFAAGFLGRMRSDAAARIFAGLQPATAYSISVILASRNVDVPTE